MKSLLLNLVALAAFAAAAPADLPMPGALLFQIAVQWLVNELWFDAYLVPVLLMQLFGRSGEGRTLARMQRAARWTSVCLLLLPSITFALLSLVDGIAGKTLGTWLGLPLGMGLYGCSFVAFGLLFVLTLMTGAGPLSVQAAIERLFDARFEEAREDIRQQDAAAAPLPDATVPQVAVDAIPSHHSPLFAEHGRDFARKQQPGEQLLLATAPAGVVPAPGEGQAYIFGGIFGAAGLFLLTNAWSLHQSGQVEGLGLTALTVVGAGFLLFALPMLLHPLLARRRLRRIDYFLTDRRLFIFRGSELFIQEWREPCVVQLQLRGGSRGDVQIIRKGLGYALLRGFFKRWAGVSEEETRATYDANGHFNNGKDMQTQALINVEGAEAIRALVMSLLAKAQQGQG